MSTAAGPATSTASPAPADMQRAYEALGLPPPSQGSNQGLNRPPSQPQGLASNLSGASGIVMNPNGNTANITPQHGQPQLHLNAARMATMNAGLPAALQGQPGSLGTPTDLTAVPNKPVKEWHQSVTQDLRNHLVHKL